MDALQTLTRVGQVAGAIRQIESFNFEQASFARVELKDGLDNGCGFAITSLNVDSFSAETWQVFFPFLRQAVEEYKGALNAELDGLMQKVMEPGEDESDAA